MAQTEYPIGFIGAGNMGEAFVGALVKTGQFRGGQIAVYDVRPECLRRLGEKFGVRPAESIGAVFASCGAVVVAVKPQQMDTVLKEIAAAADYPGGERKLLISIAAGYRIERIETHLYAPLSEMQREQVPIVRVMPNTPALVSAGMAGLSPNRFCRAADTARATRILEATGKVMAFPEDALDAVTALSGSGPAYVFYFIEAMIQAGCELGRSPEESATLVLATLEGALKLIRETRQPPEDLRRQVTSPGGTTEAALKAFERCGLREGIVAGIKAAAARAAELGR